MWMITKSVMVKVGISSLVSERAVHRTWENLWFLVFICFHPEFIDRLWSKRNYSVSTSISGFYKYICQEIREASNNLGVGEKILVNYFQFAQLWEIFFCCERLWTKRCQLCVGVWYHLAHLQQQLLSINGGSSKEHNGFWHQVWKTMRKLSFCSLLINKDICVALQC